MNTFLCWFRYFDQDILIHEMGHAIELLAAHFVIPQFKSRLEYLFEQNVKLRGMWEGTYAATNPREYLVSTLNYVDDFISSYRFLVTGVDSSTFKAKINYVDNFILLYLSLPSIVNG